jgi:Ca2+-binding RTX toxin-like protein
VLDAFSPGECTNHFGNSGYRSNPKLQASWQRGRPDRHHHPAERVARRLACVLHRAWSRFGGFGAGTAGSRLTLLDEGNSLITARDGAEVLWAGTRSSTLYAGSGPDTLIGGASGQAIMIGGTGNGAFVGSTAPFETVGGPRDDCFFIGAGSMTIIEGDGADQVRFGSGSARVSGGAGSHLYAGFKAGTDGSACMATARMAGRFSRPPATPAST